MMRLHLPVLALALALPVTSLPTPAAAQTAPIFAAKGKKKPKSEAAADDGISAADAEERRRPIQTAARSRADGGDASGAGDALANAARKFGDPILFIDAGEAFKAAAESSRDAAMVERAKAEAQIGLDILYFMQDARYDSAWEIIPTTQITSEISRGRDLIGACDDLAEAIAREKSAPPPSAEGPAEKTPRPRDGRGLIAAGSVLSVIGLGGIGLMGAGLVMGADAQKTVEDPTVYGDAFDEADAKGKRGNLFAIVGASVGGVGLIAGLTLIGLGAKRRKQYREENPVAHLRVLPGVGTLTISGRF